MKTSQKIEKHIYNLERELLKPGVRCSADSIRSILSEDFFEICNSGKVYDYAPGDVFDRGSAYEITDFRAQLLSRNCLLATYRAIKIGAEKEISASLRSSVWKRRRGNWKMVFHQGTPVN